MVVGFFESAPADPLRIVLRTCALVIVALALSMVLLGAGDRSAEAQSSFDQALSDLANAHRATLGRPALAVSASLNASSLVWSNTMLNTGNFVHDPNIGNLGENIAMSNGPPGQPVPVSWSTAAGPLPAYCTSPMDFTTARFQMCQWLSSSEHRSAIESVSFSQVGAGSVSAPDGGNRITYSTMRFTTVAPPSIDIVHRLILCRRLMVQRLCVGRSRWLGLVQILVCMRCMLVRRLVGSIM